MLPVFSLIYTATLLLSNNAEFQLPSVSSSAFIEPSVVVLILTTGVLINRRRKDVSVLQSFRADPYDTGDWFPRRRWWSWPGPRLRPRLRHDDTRAAVFGAAVARAQAPRQSGAEPKRPRVETHGRQSTPGQVSISGRGSVLAAGARRVDGVAVHAAAAAAGRRLRLRRHGARRQGLECLDQQSVLPATVRSPRTAGSDG